MNKIGYWMPPCTTCLLPL